MTRAGPRDLWSCWNEVAGRLEGAPVLLACFDYDGTLVGIKPTPEEAVAGPEVRAALSRLAAAPRTPVAVVSGRPLEDLRQLVPAADLWLVGHHGLTSAEPGGEARYAIDLDETRRRLDSLRARTAPLVEGRPGLRLEDKTVTLGLHTRNASREDARVAAEAFRRAAEGLEGFELMQGKEILEVRPVGVHKGSTVASLRARLSEGGPVLYVGDDTTDEDVFASLDEADGVTVRVGPVGEATGARYRVDAPEDVLELLRRLADLRRAP